MEVALFKTIRFSNIQQPNAFRNRCCIVIRGHLFMFCSFWDKLSKQICPNYLNDFENPCCILVVLIWDLDSGPRV